MNKKAFTLLELLVVIVTIGIIAAILLPVLGKARENARRAFCANNLRQIGMAVMMYIDDHDGYTPKVCDIPPGGEAYVCVIYEVLNQYLNDSDVFWCPSSGKESKWTGGTIPQHGKKVSYGFNTNGTGLKPDGTLSGFFTQFWDPPKSFSKIEAPTQMIVVSDSNSNGFWDYSIAYSGASPGDLHSGGSNVFFADGHVRWYLRSYLLTTPHHWNDDNADIEY